MTRDDIGAGLRLSRLSLWNQVEDDWRCFFNSPRSGGWLAEKCGAVVGTVTLLRYSPRLAWLGMMLVDPQHRRAGIGSRLMEAALDAAGKCCVRLDATPAGQPLYQRYGFVAEYWLARAAVTVAANRLPPCDARAQPMRPCDLAGVFVRDSKIFGADRSALLASFYLRAPELAWVVRDRSALLGYCFGRPGHLYRQVGPIVAENTQTARALVTCCLSRHAGNRIAVDVPQFAPEWIRWLESVGFLVERPFLRMRRGESGPPGLPDRQFAIAGPEFG